jgi:hypothetical protein
MAAGAIRSLTTEATDGTEAGRKGFRIQIRIRIRTLPSFRSVSVLSVLSVVKFGASLREAVVGIYTLPTPRASRSPVARTLAGLR